MNKESINFIEKKLCELYLRQKSYQYIDIDYQNKRESSRVRIKNLRLQYLPLDIEELCVKHGLI